ncbi:hypothetical protein [Plantactinospora mayteni]|uniref:hypothetical protein n=1 Tax=Plantactinospora mayteni TaxID=566021 RepID=UPI001943A876|nr:hypothetical protein [Plantactinospora mayteni]
MSIDLRTEPAGPATGRSRPAPVTVLHWVFVGFAALTFGMLLDGSDAAVFRTAALVGYPVAVLLSVVAALRGPERGRRITIVLHLVLAPMQFVFSIPATIALLGIPLSLTILGLSRPRFPRMSPRTRKIWLILHVGFSVGWLGVALTMTVMAIIGSAAESHALRHGAYEALHVIDLAAAIPSMFLAIITGLVLSLGTKWGLVRHWWVLVKFAISVSIPLLAGTVESALADELALRTVDPAAEPGSTGVALTACLAGFTIALWVATILSVAKPWPRTRWGRSADARERAARLHAQARG